MAGEIEAAQQSCIEGIRAEPSSIPEFYVSMRDWQEAGCSFGDWAGVHSSLIDRPQWVALSLTYGSIAYEGALPASALRAYEALPAAA